MKYMGNKKVRVSAKPRTSVDNDFLIDSSLSFSVNQESLPIFIQPGKNNVISNSSSDLVLDCVKDVSILYDKNRKQFSLKLPKELVEIYRIKQNDKLRMRIKIREGQPIEGTFGVISK